MENNETLRQAINRIHVEGILKENKLAQRKHNNENVISGSIVILVPGEHGESNEISIHTYVSEFTRSRQANSAYAGLMTFIDKAVSMATLMKPVEDGGSGMSEQAAKAQASCVAVRRGSIDVYDSFSQTGEVITRPQFKSNYFNVISPSECIPKAEFEVEMFFKSIREEKNRDGEETGRVLIEGIVPVYGGQVIPLSFVADGDAADYILENYEANHSGYVNGSIVYSVERKETKRPGFGKPKIDVVVTRKRELLVMSGDEAQYDDDDEKKAFSAKAIKKAMEIRETETLPRKKQKAQERRTQPARGNGFGSPRSNFGFEDDERPSFKF